ncbi:hypothetical protein [Microvirga splendida]|uniref:Uncharacterized protein n=1 Tax=Microvirga splendida TaxID=2795727 RepID=A0ABS0Y5F7_9HYPH|nr:hypothetical protein [Microvirga splendida]MBJ6127540.1 hypothetical protein [Microvirga splendida]
MSKSPKRPSQRDEPRRQNVEAGVQRPKPSTGKGQAASKKANTALDSSGAGMPDEGLERPKGKNSSGLPHVQSDTLALDSNLATEGNRNTPDRQGAYRKIRDEVEQLVQTGALADHLAPTESHPGSVSDPPHPSEWVEMQPAQELESTESLPMAPNLKGESREKGKRTFHNSLEGTVQQAITVWNPSLKAASERVRGASGRVKVWAQEKSEHRVNRGDKAEQLANPVYLLGAITLGIPALLLIPLVGMNPGVQEGTFMTVVTFLAVSAFVTAAVFEIKRLADQSSDDEYH